MANDRTRKRREQRWRASWRNTAQTWAAHLSDDVIDQLCLIDHPKIKADGHSMYSYVLWLCSQGYLNKAKEVVLAHTGTN